jgi:hypothetical protein
VYILRRKFPGLRTYGIEHKKKNKVIKSENSDLKTFHHEKAYKNIRKTSTTETISFLGLTKAIKFHAEI